MGKGSPLQKLHLEFSSVYLTLYRVEIFTRLVCDQNCTCRPIINFHVAHIFRRFAHGLQVRVIEMQEILEEHPLCPIISEMRYRRNLCRLCEINTLTLSLLDFNPFDAELIFKKKVTTLGTTR